MEFVWIEKVILLAENDLFVMDNVAYKYYYAYTCKRFS